MSTSPSPVARPSKRTRRLVVETPSPTPLPKASTSAPISKPKTTTQSKKENKAANMGAKITKPAVEAALKGANNIAYNIARFKITAARLEVERVNAEAALAQEKRMILALEVEKMKLQTEFPALVASPALTNMADTAPPVDMALGSSFNAPYNVPYPPDTSHSMSYADDASQLYDFTPILGQKEIAPAASNLMAVDLNFDAAAAWM